MRQKNTEVESHHSVNSAYTVRMKRPALAFAAILTCTGISLSWVHETLSASLSATANLSAEQHMEQGANSFQRGDFEQAILSWTEAKRLYEAEQRLSLLSRALTQIAQAYQALGQYSDALKNLELALTAAKSSGDRTQIADVLGRIGNVYIAIGPAESAQKFLNQGLDAAKELNNQELAAIILNNLGNLLTAQKKYPEALAAYT